VLDETSWPTAVRSLERLVGASGTFYLTADPRNGAIVRSESYGIDPSVKPQYLDYYATKEVRIAPALPVAVGRPMTEGMLLDRRVYEGSEIYNDLLAPNHIPHVLAVWAAKSPSAASAFCLERSRREGVFERQDIDRYQQILTHVLRVLRTRDALCEARCREQMGLDLLDGLPCASIVLDSALRVVAASTSARAMLNARDPLRYEASTIRAFRFSENRRLQTALKKCVHPVLSDAPPGDSMLLNRFGGGQSVRVTVIPLSRRSPFPGAAVMVLIADPLAAVPRTATTLRDTHGLTNAEARLACSLSTGITLREAAAELSLSINTCKAQLKSIYAKTGGHSHVDLMKVVALATVAGTARALGGEQDGE
jgi:DNA-binding CsgD family transcriptional regulator